MGSHRAHLSEQHNLHNISFVRNVLPVFLHMVVNTLTISNHVEWCACLPIGVIEMANHLRSKFCLGSQCLQKSSKWARIAAWVSAAKELSTTRLFVVLLQSKTFIFTWLLCSKLLLLTTPKTAPYYKQVSSLYRSTRYHQLHDLQFQHQPN